MTASSNKLVGLSETASSLVPMFNTPVSIWATKTKLILESRGITDFKDPKVRDMFLPLIIGRLPVYLLQVAPVTDLEDLFKFLMIYDKETVKLSTFFKDSANKLDVKPRVKFLMLVDQIKSTMAVGTPIDTVREIAWSLLQQAFPVSMQPYLSLLGINNYPTDDQLLRLDNAYDTFLENINKPQVFSNMAGSEVNMNATVMNRLDKMESMMNNFISDMSKPKVNTPQAEGRTGEFPQNYTPGFSGSENRYQNRYQRPTYQQGRFPQYGAVRNPGFRQSYNPGNNQYFQRPYGQTANAPRGRIPWCFYHARFGRNAYRCDKPCGFVSNCIVRGSLNE